MNPFISTLGKPRPKPKVEVLTEGRSREAREPLEPPGARVASPEVSQALLEARAIIQAGRKRRGEVIDEAPPPGSMAAQIIEAGKRRRGET